MDFDDLLGNTVELFQQHPDVLEPLPAALPPRPGRRVPGHQPRPERAGPAARPPSTATSASSATATSPSTPSGAPTSATSSSSRRPSPTPPSSCSSRTTARPRPSSTPPTPSSPTTSGRKPKELWTDAGRRRADRPLPRRRRGRRGAVGRPRDAPACTTAATTAGATSPSSTGPTPRAGCSRSSSCGSGIPYKVVGGTRFYDRREVKDAARLPEGRGQPGRRGRGQAGPQHAQAGRRRHAPIGRLDAWASSHGVTFLEALRRRRRGRASAARAVKGIAAFLDLIDELADGRRRGPGGRCSRPSLERSGYVGRARGRALASRPRAASRTWPSWSASAQRVRRRRRVPRAGQPGGRHRRARRRRVARSC